MQISLSEKTFNKSYYKDILKYTFGLGAGVSLGYFIYRQFFFHHSKNLYVEPLTQHEAMDRIKYIKDVKYDVSFKLLYQENINLHSINSALVKSSIRGYLEIEFNLTEYRDVSLEFSGVLLSLKKFNSEEKVLYDYCNKSHRIMIKKESLKLGKNKFCFTFTHANCDKGILYNEKVKYFFLFF